MWRNSLPDHLQFTEENLRIQESMFESGSGNAAFCFYFAHLADVCSALVAKVSSVGAVHSLVMTFDCSGIGER
jgi:hypothetical protein